MTDPRPSLDARYFEALYTGSPDPWDFRSSRYERDKYAATLAILPRPRYESSLEIGCSIGVFTRQLARRCDAVLALDASATALAEAKRDCADLGHVAFCEAMVPLGFPAGKFDLILLSEVLYFLSRRDLEDLAARCLDAIVDGGDIVLCHWLGETDYPLGGDEAADLFIAATRPRLRMEEARREERYRLDLLSAPR